MSGFDRADWSPVRAGTATGKILSAILPSVPPDRSRRILLAQQPWHIRGELIVATIIWSFLPVSIATALIEQSLRNTAARVFLIFMLPLITPVLVQCSMLAVGALMLVLRRTGIRRETEDGWIQAAVWGIAGTALAIMALRRDGLAHWLGLLWIAILCVEVFGRIVVAIMSRRLDAISRSREVNN